MIDIYVIAGEPSADKLGAPIIQELLRREPTLQIGGIAGPYLREVGVKGSIRMEDLQVMGFSAVLAAFPRLLKLFSHTLNEILRLKPKAVLCIDYPGFNLRLARSLRKRGYTGKLIHAVCPTVWAWGKRRIGLMAQNLDLLLTLFPFEKDCFANSPLCVAYMGHPLVAKVRAHTPFLCFRECYGLDAKKPILALFPGSRKGVIEKNLPLQLAAIQELQLKIPDISVAISLAQMEHRELIRSMAPQIPLIEPVHTYDLMRSAHVALATSGTITLELALFGVPTVVNYAIRSFDCFIAQKIFRIRLDHYCIVNILTKRRVFPELFGPNLQIDSLLEQLERVWRNREESIRGCEEMRVVLGNLDAASMAAEAILTCLKKPVPSLLR